MRAFFVYKKIKKCYNLLKRKSMALSTKEFYELTESDGLFGVDRYFTNEEEDCTGCPVGASKCGYLTKQDYKYLKRYNVSGCARAIINIFFSIHPDAVKENEKEIINYIKTNNDYGGCDLSLQHISCDGKVTGGCFQFLKKLYEFYVGKKHILKIEGTICRIIYVCAKTGKFGREYS